MKITINNTFHNTSVTLIINSSPIELSEYQVKRTKRTLCGCNGCCCGGMWDSTHTEIEDFEGHHFEPIMDFLTGQVCGAELVEN